MICRFTRPRAVAAFFLRSSVPDGGVRCNAGFPTILASGGEWLIPEEAMRLLAWMVKIGFFLLVLWFALKNTTPVPVRLTSTMTWEHVPLILVMLVCIAVGCAARRAGAGLADLPHAA